jgi:sec-independent protein translocase protein TatA
MLRGIGPTELLIILAIILLLFGVGRVSKIGKELGSAVSSFRSGLKEGQEEEAQEDETPHQA